MNAPELHAHQPRFALGQIVSTPGAIAACSSGYMLECLFRHQRGDWGHACAEDKATNEEAVGAGMRLISSYAIDPAKPCKGWGDNTLWVITEADRSVTTLLLPSEY